ncbi:Fic family protein [Bosea sp. 117]|uniref:Fic family protein n=1 Tax=Bosea sp. 117 TaxID=1125973 RepID=UPI000493D8A5|nr:Fic family protein [Bosea sp. 117]
MTEPVWVEPAFIMELNERFALHSGGPFLLRDRGVLESAAMAPRDRWRTERLDDPGILGLALAMAIARNHPFAQGNEQTAWAAMLAFFALNGLALENQDHPYYAEIFIDVIAGEQPVEHLIDQMRLSVFE